MFAKTPKPPYVAVIFTNLLTDTTLQTNEQAAYDQTADEMVRLASEQEGFLGFESSRNDQGFGISVSYWDTMEHVKRWKQNADHLTAQKNGQKKWYQNYTTRICVVERDYSF